MLLLRDHLQQDRAGDVALGLLVDDHEVDPLDHQPADIGERDVPTLYRVVQPPVGILLNYSRFAHRRALTMGYRTLRSAGPFRPSILQPSLAQQRPHLASDAT